MISRSFLAVLLVVAAFSAAVGNGKSLRVSVGNPSAFVRENETIEIPLNVIFHALGRVDTASLTVSDSETNAVLLSQATGTTLLFQTTLPPRGRKEFTVRSVGSKKKLSASPVDGRYVLPREDYAWENDRIAFRMYGPALAAEVNNGIDVWCKRVKYLIVAKWYRESESAPPGKDTYHQDRGEGADFFEVGRSLGAGGSGIWVNGAVLQPGVFTSQRTLLNGPIRVSFELTYKWQIAGYALTERKVITLDAGQNLNRVAVTFLGSVLGDTLTLVCGLVKRANTSPSMDASLGRMTLWGLTNADTVNGYLGTAVVIPSPVFRTFAEDKEQFLLLAKTMTGSTLTYCAGAGWSRNGEFHSADDWNGYVDRTAQALRAPLLVTYVERSE